MKRLLFPLLLSLSFVSAKAGASEGPLGQVERAYAEVDFARTLDLARAALRAGGNTPARTARLYLLLGISAAALDEAEEARTAFTRVLALDPSMKLEQSLSP